MNTVKIGDQFEDNSYTLIVNAIENGELGISNQFAKVCRKKGYYSKDREKEIIFDLSIEIWPHNAERYSLLYLIECKSSNSKKVPVDDVEEFSSKVTQVAGLNVKAVMISDNSFQEGGIIFAKNKGMMLIEVNKSGEHSILLHRLDSSGINNDENIDELFFNFIKKILGIRKIEGLKKLSVTQIEKEVENCLCNYEGGYTPIDIPKLMCYLEKEYNLIFDFCSELKTVRNRKILGYYDVVNNKIVIDSNIVNTYRFPFVFGHELGHFFLHKGLRVNQEQYNDFEDSEYDIFENRHILKNEKNWIEWQANRFAVSLFLPKMPFLERFFRFRISIGISRYSHIYLDDQPVNQSDYRQTVNYMSRLFGMSKTSIKYRIEELNLITYSNTRNDLRGNIRSALFEQ